MPNEPMKYPENTVLQLPGPSRELNEKERPKDSPNFDFEGASIRL